MLIRAPFVIIIIDKTLVGVHLFYACICWVAAFYTRVPRYIFNDKYLVFVTAKQYQCKPVFYNPPSLYLQGVQILAKKHQTAY